MNQVSLTPLQRLFLAFVAFFAVLFNRRFAEGVKLLRERALASPEGEPLFPGSSAATQTVTITPPPVEARGPSEVAHAIPSATPPPPTPEPATPPPAPAVAEPPPAPVAAEPPPMPEAPKAKAPAEPGPDEGLHILALLQRDGRLVDFVSEDLTGFSNAEIGAAARTVHEGCRKVIDAYLKLEPVYHEPEGASVTVGDGFDPAAVRLTGNVVGKPPFKGSLRHHGWRVKSASFPPLPAGGDVRILAPAEVEL